MSNKNELNQPKKKLKQTSILDFISIKTNSGICGDNCSQISGNSSDIQMVSTEELTQMTLQSNEETVEVINCSQLSGLSNISEIPETPERVVEDEPIDFEDEKKLLSSLNKMPDCLLPLPPLRPDSSHFVLFNVPISRVMDCVPKPFPNNYSDKWDGQHVKMPNSPNNQITSVQSIEGQTVRTRFSKWELIQEKLLSDIKCCEQLEELIKTYNPFANKYVFDVLHHFFEDCTQEENNQFFDDVLPQMIGLALQLPEIVTQSVPMLRQRRNCSLFLSQQQIACLLANAFFCTFPKRSQTNEEYKNYPIINFLSLFTTYGCEDSLNTKLEKLKCLFNYFRRVLKDMPKGIVSFERKFITREEIPVWHNSNKMLNKLIVIKKGVIETEGKGLLQVDFANKLIGGGVIGSGCVQEEIRFLICPELIISRLFTEKLLDNEVIVICGSEQFNQYSGYANTFEWMGNYIDDTPRDEWGRRLTRIVAMDALYFSHNEIDIQYESNHFERELNKAFSGFLIKRRSDPKHKCAIASGNWGCGAFNGDPLLKAIIQLMAASETERDLVLFTFNDLSLKKRIENFYSFLIENQFCVRNLYKGVLSFNKYRKQFKIQNKTNVFDFIQNNKQLIKD